MKIKTSFILLMFMAVFALAAAGCSQPVSSSIFGAASFSAEKMSVFEPQIEDKSEIGSTDGILVMGILIVAITSLPLLLRNKRK